MKVPAHKVVGDLHKPAQLEIPRVEHTLTEYIARKADDFDYFKPYVKPQEEKKLTFEEWYKSLKAKPGQMPYDDWFVGMQEAFRIGVLHGKIS